MRTKDEGSAAKYTVKVLGRAARVLSELSGETQGLTLDELSSKSQLHKPTVYRILATLEQEGLVERTENRPVRYTIGLQSIIVGTGILRRRVAVMARTQSILASVAAATGETVGLYIPWGKEKTCVASASSPHPPQFRMEAGASTPLCTGAGGKILLAYMPYEDSKRIIEQTLPVIQRFPGTASEVDVLLAELESTRRRGFAVSRAEQTVDGLGIAVPVRSHQESVVAAIGIVTWAGRIPEVRIPEIVSALMEGSSHLLKTASSAPTEDYAFCGSVVE